MAEAFARAPAIHRAEQAAAIDCAEGTALAREAGGAAVWLLAQVMPARCERSQVPEFRPAGVDRL